MNIKQQLQREENLNISDHAKKIRDTNRKIATIGEMMVALKDEEGIIAGKEYFILDELCGMYVVETESGLSTILPKDNFKK